MVSRNTQWINIYGPWAGRPWNIHFPIGAHRLALRSINTNIPILFTSSSRINDNITVRLYSQSCIHLPKTPTECHTPFQTCLMAHHYPYGITRGLIPPYLAGTILVQKVAYKKHVAVRFTLDDWQTTSEVRVKHVVSVRRFLGNWDHDAVGLSPTLLLALLPYPPGTGFPLWYA